jgi:hypothetical protein
MSGIGVTELFVLGIIFGVVVFPLLGLALFVATFARRAKRFGYPTTRAYLRAAPRSDEERRDAADLARCSVTRAGCLAWS